MKAITHLPTLLAHMEPELKPDEFVFVSLASPQPEVVAALHPVATFCEAEGLSLIVDRAAADARRLPYEAVFRLISLHVHSSLQAVGLTAAISSALARNGISANVVAACYHDHLFVPAPQAQRALQILKTLGEE